MIADPSAPSFDDLRLQLDAGIGRLTLNRPHKLNALSPATMRQIIDACRWLAARDDLRVLLLDGAGRAFCGGFDLDAMREGRGTADRNATDLGRRMIDALEAIPAITLSLVQGHCVGGGVLLALACDLCIAADDARFSIPEMELGIPLGWGGVPRLIRRVGPAVAMELVLDCTPFDAAQALAWRCHQPRRGAGRSARPLALAWAQRLAGRPMNALRATKQRFREAGETLCSAAGSEIDADALLAAYRDPETLAVQQRYIAARRG